MLNIESSCSLYIGDTVEICERHENGSCLSYFETRYIADDKSIKLIPNFNVGNVHLNEEFEFKLKNTNIVSAKWEFDGKEINEKCAKYTYTSPGYKRIKVTAVMFGNREVKQEFEINVMGSSLNKNIDLSKLEIVDIIDNVDHENVLISHGTAPIAPIPSGGFYLCWT